MQTSVLSKSLINAISTNVTQTALYRALVNILKSLKPFAKWNLIAMAASVLFRIKARIGNRRRTKEEKAASVSLPATQSVLNTYELLEGILSHLDPHSLRKAQLVCPAWNDMIVHSSRQLATSRNMGLDGTKLRRLALGVVGADRSGKGALLIKWAWTMYLDVFDPTLEEAYPRKVLSFDNDSWMLEALSIRSPITPGNPIPPPSLSPSILWSPLGLSYLRSVDAYVLVYSVTDRTAFTRLKYLAENLKVVSAEQVLQRQQEHRQHEQYQQQFQQQQQQRQQQQQQSQNQQQNNQQSNQQDHLQLQTETQPHRSSGDRPAKQRPLALIATKCDLETLVSGDWEVTHEEGVTLAAELGCPFYETSARSGEGVDECFDGVLRQYKEERLRVAREESERRLRLMRDGVTEDVEFGGDVDDVRDRARRTRTNGRRFSVWDKRKLGLVARKFRGEKGDDVNVAG